VKLPTLRPWPRSIAGRTLLLLLLGLFSVQVIGLLIHALDRIDLQRGQETRETVERVQALWRSVVIAGPGRRDAVLRELLAREQEDGAPLRAWIAQAPPEPEAEPGPERANPRRDHELPRPVERALTSLRRGGPPHLRPREVVARAGESWGEFELAARLPDGPWLMIEGRLSQPRIFASPTFLAALALMFLTASLLSAWAVRRLTRPIGALAEAAERLGRDVNAPPLPETGPTELVQAARAFNGMQASVRSFVQGRTEMLAAIGHDLRTPITRLRLRAEFVDDDQLRTKILSDLAEMEAMITATLAFARDEARAEAAVPLDLAALLRTVADETNDVAGSEVIELDAPRHLGIRARPIALKRAIANLVGNAVAYAGGGRIEARPESGRVVVTIEDEGPGIPEAELDQVFLPFHRVDPSRSRETGGVGLGLSVARTVLRAHGGDVTLTNRPGGGLSARVLLPA